MFVFVHNLIVCFSLFIVDFLPYLAIYPFGEKGEHGLWHSVAAATVGAGHRHGIYRGLPFDVHGPECVTADITFECCYSSMHTCFLAANILFIIIRVKFIIVHLTRINQKERKCFFFLSIRQ